MGAILWLGTCGIFIVLFTGALIASIVDIYEYGKEGDFDLFFTSIAGLVGFTLAAGLQYNRLF